MTYYAGVPITVSVSIVDAGGDPYDLASVSASFGFIGSGPPSVVAMASSQTGVYTAVVTPSEYGQGTFTVTVRGFDDDGNLQAVGVCRVIVTPVPQQ
jgi:hypothetical protein